MFDFTEVFTQIGKLFTLGLQNRILDQTGIDGTAYAKPEDSTLRSRRSKLKKVTLKGTKRTKKRPLTSVTEKRLCVTRDLAFRGFEAEADPNGVTVKVSGKTHMAFGDKKQPTYREIIGWNSRGQKNLNKNIKAGKAPLVFPTSSAEVRMIQKELVDARKLFATECDKQMREKGISKTKLILNIG